MPLIHLVRHGEAAAAWGDHDDPGLSELGVKQAAHAASLVKALAPKSLWTSPLKRCQETAAAYAMESGLTPRIEPGVAEIPTPKEIEDRQAWLRALMQGDWQPKDGLAHWRASVVQTLLSVEEDTVVFTHFVAINVAAGAAEGLQKVTLFRPAHCSITTLSTEGAKLTLVRRGEENAAVQVL